MNEVDLGAQAVWLLLAAGALSGFASLWVFYRWSDAAKLRVAANRIVAHLFELQLFAEEPAVVLRAQRDLIAANGELLRQVAVPSLLLVVPFSILLVALDAVCGHAPLQLGKRAVITVKCRFATGTRLPQAQLSTPGGIQIDTPAVRIPSSSQISWGIRPLRAVKGRIKILVDGHSIDKSISSAPGLQWLSDSRAGSTVGFLRHPLELPASFSGIQSISVLYPDATVFNVNWMIWFFVASFISALASALVVPRFR